MTLVFDAQVVIGTTAALIGLAVGFFGGWGSRGRAEKSLRTELVRLEERLVGQPPKRTEAQEQELLDSAKTMVVPRRARVERASTRTMSLAQVNEHAQRARDEG